MGSDDEEFLRAHTPENKLIAERNAISVRYRKLIDTELKTLLASLAVAGVCITGGITQGIWNFTRPHYPLISTYNTTNDSLRAIDSTQVIIQEPASAQVNALLERINQTQTEDRARLESRLRMIRHLPAYKRERVERQHAFWTPLGYGVLLSLVPLGFAVLSGYRTAKLEQEKNKQLALYKQTSRPVN